MKYNVNKIIWKVILIIGGFVGGFYSIPKIIDASSLIEKYQGDDLLMAFGWSYFQDAQRTLALCVGLLIVSLICLLIGCCLSPND